MTDFGIQITGLIIEGPGRTAAEVYFESGLSVVWGASDTGKSFIVQCIDFMLGGSRPPKQIPEAAGYTSARIGLRLKQDDSSWVVERALAGGHFHYWPGMIGGPKPSTPKVLKAKHSGIAEDTLSHFLLAASGLAGRRVLQSKVTGRTRTLSFRDLATWVLVSEETIISESSPVLSGQYTTRTAEEAVFRTLLTGIDDSSVAGIETLASASLSVATRAAVVEQLLVSLYRQGEELSIDVSQPLAVMAEFAKEDEANASALASLRLSAKL